MTASTDIEKACLKPLAEIFDNGQIGLVYELYQHNAVQHMPWGDHYGREAVIREATALLAAFPDLAYRTVATITAPGDDGTLKILEHFQWQGTHTGFGIYGPPTDHGITVSGLRLLECRDGRIITEWFQDDRLSLIRQLALDPRDVARRMQTAAPVDFTWEAGSGEIVHSMGQTPPDPWPRYQGKTDPEVLIHTLVQKMWNWRLLAAADELFAGNCHFDLGGGVSLENLAEFKADALNRLAAFSDLTITVDDIFWQKEENTVSAALRWTLTGTHNGFSSYGSPSGARLCLPGLSRMEIRRQRIVSIVERFGELVLGTHQDHACPNSAEAADNEKNQNENQWNNSEHKSHE